MDYVCGNHGLNSIFTATQSRPMTMAYGDIDENGTKDPLVFKYTGSVNAPFVNKDLLTSHMPSFNKRFYNFREYAKATFGNMITDDMQNRISLYQVKEMKTTALINDGQGNFNIIPLPVEAQMAPVCGMISEDFNADGFLDLLLCGNSNSNHFEYGNIDALGTSLFFGDGKGKFKFVPRENSGLVNEGYGKSMALWSDQQKNIMVSIATNDGPLQTYRLSKSMDTQVCPPGKYKGTVLLKNGQKRKWEFCPGGGYLSQSAPFIVVNSGIERIDFN